MSYIDSDILKSFFKNNSWITVDEEDPTSGVGELITQIDSIIYNKTGVEVPDSPGDAPGILRNHACALFVWFSSGKQGDISSDERLRREKLYDEAMTYLNAVDNGDIEVYDDEGEVVSRPGNDFGASFESTQRITDTL
jgi:phage gp36-like protein